MNLNVFLNLNVKKRWNFSGSGKRDTIYLCQSNQTSACVILGDFPSGLSSAGNVQP